MTTGENHKPFGDLRKVPLKPGYDTEHDDIVKSLYSPCLSASETYDRAVGYFRANIYRELGEPILDFVIKGGKVRIVCSPDIPAKDEQAAREGYDLRGKRSKSDQEADLASTMEAMSEDPDEVDCLEMLRLLIELESLDLFVATRSGGIYHRKVGRFADGAGNSVVFSGSGNETIPAITSIEDWSNDEEFDVFRSWGGEFEKGRANTKSSYLARLFNGGTAHTKVRPINLVEKAILARFRTFSSLEQARLGARKRTEKPVPPEEAPLSFIKPYFYQETAIENWYRAGRVGLLSMATGTGKTITALFALKPVIEEGSPILIVVPSSALLDQWYSNIRAVYPMVPIMRAGGGWNWREDTSKRLFISETKRPRIVLATMQTASSPDFLEFMRQAAGVTLVADEAHRLGSERNRRLLELNFRSRLGLSATPERLFDPVGDQALRTAFGERPVFDLPLNGKVKLSPNDPRDVSILGRFLSRYHYSFETVMLSATEQEQWDKLAEEAGRLMARNKGVPIASLLQNSRLKILLIERARIVKRARGKVEVASRVLRAKYPENGRWIVYCEDEDQLNLVISRLRSDDPARAILPYHSKMSLEERQATLEHFLKHASVIVSIRCLDEGVDLPAADGGLILASSSNPREYIQRRGRLLRTAVGKDRAEIVDAIVIPRAAREDEDVPTSIIRSEIARAYLFAKDAENSEVTHDLWKLCREYGVVPERDAEIDSDLESEVEA